MLTLLTLRWTDIIHHDPYLCAVRFGLTVHEDTVPNSNGDTSQSQDRLALDPSASLSVADMIV